jgi:para-aminobenzoate synthetase component 1
MARVAQALEYIRAGDIYQANITAAFKARRPAARAADIFRALQAENPAPFSAFVAFANDCAIASVSPERFVRIDHAGNTEARPIKGTRPRGATPAADAAQANALLASEKDRAENLMIVDLLRNDLSRVSRTGSVAVPRLNELESFASVHHLVSTITATLQPGKSAVDLLRAALPGGSITGAPKIRAMQIIAELEGAARGPYCGSAFWIGFDGAMDSNILIRTLTVTESEIIAQAGGGIVADSEPAGEWDEVMVKVTPLLRALGDVPCGAQQAVLF